MEKRYELINRVLEYGIYVYIALMFLSKGESIRNVLIFGGFCLWLITLKHRKNLYLLKEAIPLLLWLYAGSFIFSVVFSMNPAVSLKAVKGDPLKFALIFPVIATIMTEEVKLRRTVYVISFTTIFLVAAGYYSYLSQDLPMLRPTTDLVHAYHNRFAGHINTFLPFFFIVYFVWKSIAGRIIFMALFSISVFAMILSTSRGGYLAFLGIAGTWAFYLANRGKHSFKKIIVLLLIAFLVVGGLAYISFPDVGTRINNLSFELRTFNDRTELWGAAFYAFMKRPVYGWGHGNSFFHEEEPFVGTPYGVPERGEHNMYLSVLFHQGIIGFIPFILLVIVSIKTFWREALQSSGLKSLILIACLSIFVGNYLLHSMLESMFRLPHVAVILGLGMAAKGIDENSYN